MTSNINNSNLESDHIYSELLENKSICNSLDFGFFFEDNIDAFSTGSDQITHFRIDPKELITKRGRKKKEEDNNLSGHSKNKSDNKYNKIFRSFFKFIFHYLTLINNNFKFRSIFYKSQVYGARKLNDFFGNTIENFLETDEENKKKINEVKESESSKKFEEFFEMKVDDVYQTMFLPWFKYEPKCQQEGLLDFAESILLKYKSKKYK